MEKWNCILYQFSKRSLQSPKRPWKLELNRGATHKGKKPEFHPDANIDFTASLTMPKPVFEERGLFYL
jgi:hypothetical protein